MTTSQTDNGPAAPAQAEQRELLPELAELLRAEPVGSALQRAAALVARACGCAAAVLAPLSGGPIAVSPDPPPALRDALLELAPDVARTHAPRTGTLADGTPWAGAPLLTHGQGIGTLLAAQPLQAAAIDVALLEALATCLAPLVERALGERRDGPAGLDATLLLESLSDPAALIDLEGRVLVANPPFQALIQAAGIADLRETSLATLQPRDRQGRAVRGHVFLSPRLREGRGVRVERILRMADGSDRAYAVTISPLRSLDGSIVAAVSVLREITETIARERALRLMQEIRRGLSLEENLRQAARSVCRRAVTQLDWVDMAAILTLADSGAGFLAQFGFPVRAARLLAGLPLAPPYPPPIGATTDRASVFQSDADEPGNEVARQFVVAAGAATFVTLPLDAGTRRFGILLLAGRAPHRPSRDELAMLETLALQIGAELEGVRRREQAESERARLQAVVDQLPEGVLLFDAAGRLTLFNRSAITILGTSFEQGAALHGLPPRLGLVRADGREYRYGDDPVSRTFSTGRAVLGEEALVRRANGSETPIVANVAPVRDSSGELTAVIMIFQDITALREMDRLKDDFLSIAGHELRTPLASVLGYAQLLERRFDRLDRAAILSALRGIREQSEAMAALIDELLDVSRIRTGRLVLERGVCDVVSIAREAIERLQPQRLGPVTLETPPRAPVFGDARRLGQVFANILSNAAKYSDPTAPIEVRIAIDGGSVRVSVRDYGIGIPPEALGRLFERFYRADNAAARAGGLGLGLYLCQEIVEQHNGSIEVRSTLGQGSEFTVRLPLYIERDGRGG